MPKITKSDGSVEYRDLTDAEKQALAQKASQKKAARKAKAKNVGQAAKNYLKNRVDRVINGAKAGANLVTHIKSPDAWVGLGKTVVDGEVSNVKALGDLTKAIFNHPSFYEHYEELLHEMVTPNFARVSGRVDKHLVTNLIGETPASGSDVAFRDGLASIPKVAAISLKLVRNSDADGFKLAIDRLYQSISNANNNIKTGSLANYVELIMITRSLVACIEQGRRAYGTLKKFELLDESVPMAYFAAYGLDYNSFKENAADLRNFLNSVISEMNSRAMFKLDLFSRTISLFRGHYADNPTVKHQDYVFRPLFIETPSYDGETVTISEISPCLDTLGSNVTGLTYSNYINIVKAELKKLTALEVYSDIRGNIIKAYGLNLFQMDKIPEDYYSISVYSEYMLSALKNATLCGNSITLTSNLIGLTSNHWLDTDERLTQSVMRCSENIFDGEYIDAYKDKLTNSEFISSTRLTVAGDLEDNTNYIVFDTFGTEVACEMVIPFKTTPAWVAALSGNTEYNIILIRYSRFTMINTQDIHQDVWGLFMLSLFLWSLFDWHPLYTPIIGEYNSKDEVWLYTSYVPMWDFANYAWVDHDPFMTYHNIAVKNLYFAPLLYIQKKTEVIPAN